MALLARTKTTGCLVSFGLFVLNVWASARAESAIHSMDWHGEKALLLIAAELTWLRSARNIDTVLAVSVPNPDENAQNKKTVGPPEKANSENTSSGFSESGSWEANGEESSEGGDDGDNEDNEGHQVQAVIELSVNWNQVLLNAAAQGSLELVMAALQHGAEINTSNEQGQTPLWLAVSNGHTAVAVLLVDWGADLAALVEGYNPLDLTLAVLLHAQQNQDTDQAAHYTTVMHHMLSANGQLAGVDSFSWFVVHDVALVEQALEQLGEDVNVLHEIPLPLENDGGQLTEYLWALNPAHVAIITGSLEVLEYLCLHNQHWVNEQAVCNETGIRVFAINLAASLGRADMVIVLLQCGAGLGRAHQVFEQQMQQQPQLTLEGVNNLLCMSPIVYIFRLMNNPQLQQLAVSEIVRRNQQNLMGLVDYTSASSHINEGTLKVLANQLNLFTVIRERHFQALALLIRTGVNLNQIETVMGNQRLISSPTPLTLACSMRSLTMVRMLVKGGAYVLYAEQHALNFMRLCRGGMSYQQALARYSRQYADRENHSVLVFVFALSDDQELQAQVFSQLRSSPFAFEMPGNIFHILAISGSSAGLVNLIRHFGPECLQAIRQSDRELMPGHIQPWITGFNGDSTLFDLASAVLICDASLSEYLGRQAEQQGRKDILRLLKRLGLIKPGKKAL